MLYIERGGRGVATFPAFDDEDRARLAIGVLARWIAGMPRSAGIQRIDGEPPAQSDRAQLFIDAGFVAGYRGLTYRAPRPEAMAGARGR